MTKTLARILATFLLVLVAAGTWAAGYGQSGGNRGAHQKKELPDSGKGDAEPFDPAAATEVVSKTAAGGVRRVVAHESGDAKQIGLIRTNLKSQAETLGPDTFLGAAFGALRSAAPGTLRAQFVEIRAGGEVRFASSDPQLIEPLQSWLESQQAVNGASSADGPARKLP